MTLPSIPQEWFLVALIAPLVLFWLLTRGGPVFQSRGVSWFRRPTNRPALYIIQSLEDPRLIKVGYTARKVETRMAEIAAQRGKVRLLFSLRMPHAYAAEQAAHAALSRSWRVKTLGGEWYAGDPARIRKIVMKAANGTRWRAKMRFAWPKNAKIFVWKDF